MRLSCLCLTVSGLASPHRHRAALGWVLSASMTRLSDRIGPRTQQLSPGALYADHGPACRVARWLAAGVSAARDGVLFLMARVGPKHDSHPALADTPTGET